MKVFLQSLAALLISSVCALAQSPCPPIVYGAVLTPAQWQSCFMAKADVGSFTSGGASLPYTPLNKAGDSMLGELTTFPSAAGGSGLNIAPGAAPSSPANGDVWVTAAGMFVRINGVTLGPLSALNAGGTLTGELITAASTTASAGLNLPQGSAPTSPVNGDVWTTSAGLFIRIAGTTIGPVGPGNLATASVDCTGTVSGSNIPLTCVSFNGGTTFGTAAAAATGVTGHTLPYLDGINTASAAWTFTGGDFHNAASTFSGGLVETSKNVTSLPYNVGATDEWLCVKITAAGTINLPASPSDGRAVQVADCSGATTADAFSANTVTVKTTDGSTIDGTAGATGLQMTIAKTSNTFKYNLTNTMWKVM